MFENAKTFLQFLVPIITGALNGFCTFGLILLSGSFFGATVSVAISLGVVNGLLNIVFYHRDISRIGVWLLNGSKGEKLWSTLYPQHVRSRSSAANKNHRHKKPRGGVWASIAWGAGYFLYVISFPLSVPLCWAFLEGRFDLPFFRGDHVPHDLFRSYRYRFGGMMGLAELELQVRWKHLSEHLLAACESGNTLQDPSGALTKAIDLAFANDCETLEAVAFYPVKQGEQKAKRDWLGAYLKTLQKAKDKDLVDKRNEWFYLAYKDHNCAKIIRQPKKSVYIRHGVSFVFLILSLALSVSMCFLYMKGLGSAVVHVPVMKAVILTTAGALTPTGLGVFVPLLLIAFVAIASQLYVTLNEFWVDAYQPARTFSEASSSAWKKFKEYMFGDGYEQKKGWQKWFNWHFLKKFATLSVVGALVALAVICTIGLWHSYRDGLAKVFGKLTVLPKDMVDGPTSSLLGSMPKLLAVLRWVVNISLISRLMMAVVMMARAGLECIGIACGLVWFASRYMRYVYHKYGASSHVSYNLGKEGRELAHAWTFRKDIYKCFALFPMIILNATANTSWPSSVNHINDDVMRSSAFLLSMNLMIRNGFPKFVTKAFDRYHESIAKVGSSTLQVEAIERFFAHRSKHVESYFGVASVYQQDDLAVRAYYLLRMMENNGALSEGGKPVNPALVNQHVMRLSEGTVLDIDQLRSMVPSRGPSVSKHQAIFKHLKKHLMSYDDQAIFQNETKRDPRWRFAFTRQEKVKFFAYLSLLPLAFFVCLGLESWGVRSLRKYRIQLKQFFTIDVDRVIANAFMDRMRFNIHENKSVDKLAALITAWLTTKCKENNTRWSDRHALRILSAAHRAELLNYLKTHGSPVGGELDCCVQQLSNHAYQSYEHMVMCPQASASDVRDDLCKSINAHHALKHRKGFFARMYDVGFIRWLYAGVGVGGALWWWWPFISQAVSGIATVGFAASPGAPVLFLVASLCLVCVSTVMLWRITLAKKRSTMLKSLVDRDSLQSFIAHPDRQKKSVFMAFLSVMGAGGATWFCIAVYIAIAGMTLNPVAVVAVIGVAMLVAALIQGRRFSSESNGKSWRSYWQGSTLRSYLSFNAFSKVVGPGAAMWFLWSAVQVIVPSLHVVGLATAGISTVAVTVVALNWAALAVAAAIIIYAAYRFVKKTRASKVVAQSSSKTIVVSHQFRGFGAATVTESLHMKILDYDKRAISRCQERDDALVELSTIDATRSDDDVLRQVKQVRERVSKHHGSGRAHRFFAQCGIKTTSRLVACLDEVLRDNSGPSARNAVSFPQLPSTAV